MPWLDCLLVKNKRKSSYAVACRNFAPSASSTTEASYGVANEKSNRKKKTKGKPNETNKNRNEPTVQSEARNTAESSKKGRSTKNKRNETEQQYTSSNTVPGSKNQKHSPTSLQKVNCKEGNFNDRAMSQNIKTVKLTSNLKAQKPGLPPPLPTNKQHLNSAKGTNPIEVRAPTAIKVETQQYYNEPNYFMNSNEHQPYLHIEDANIQNQEKSSLEGKTTKEKLALEKLNFMKTSQTQVASSSYFLPSTYELNNYSHSKGQHRLDSPPAKPPRHLMKADNDLEKVGKHINPQLPNNDAPCETPSINNFDDKEEMRNNTSEFNLHKKEKPLEFKSYQEKDENSTTKVDEPKHASLIGLDNTFSTKNEFTSKIPTKPNLDILHSTTISINKNVNQTDLMPLSNTQINFTSSSPSGDLYQSDYNKISLEDKTEGNAMYMDIRSLQSNSKHENFGYLSHTEPDRSDVDSSSNDFITRSQREDFLSTKDAPIYKSCIDHESLSSTYSSNEIVKTENQYHSVNYFSGHLYQSDYDKTSLENKTKGNGMHMDIRSSQLNIKHENQEPDRSDVYSSSNDFITISQLEDFLNTKDAPIHKTCIDHERLSSTYSSNEIVKRENQYHSVNPSAYSKINIEANDFSFSNNYTNQLNSQLNYKREENITCISNRSSDKRNITGSVTNNRAKEQENHCKTNVETLKNNGQYNINDFECSTQQKQGIYSKEKLNIVPNIYDSKDSITNNSQNSVNISQSNIPNLIYKESNNYSKEELQENVINKQVQDDMKPSHSIIQPSYSTEETDEKRATKTFDLNKPELVTQEKLKVDEIKSSCDQFETIDPEKFVDEDGRKRTPEQFQSIINTLNELRQKAQPFEKEIENFTELEDSNKYYFIDESLKRIIDKLDDMYDEIQENKYLREERKQLYKYIFPLFDRLDDKVKVNREKKC